MNIARVLCAHAVSFQVEQRIQVARTRWGVCGESAKGSEEPGSSATTIDLWAYDNRGDDAWVLVVLRFRAALRCLRPLCMCLPDAILHAGTASGMSSITDTPRDV